MSVELKPCPFCGSKDIKLCGSHVYWVICNGCYAKTAIDAQKKKAIEFWNRRVESQRESAQVSVKSAEADECQ